MNSCCNFRDGKALQINLERNDNQLGSILCSDEFVSTSFPSLGPFFNYTHLLAMRSLESKHFKNVSNF